MADRPKLLDVVELVGPLHGWPAGTIATVVETLGDYALVEIDTDDDLVVVDAAYDDLRVTERHTAQPG